jgi:hypothetical protein
MFAEGLQRWWAEHRRRVIQAALVLMIITAPHRLAVGLSRLLYEQSSMAAIDLKLRYREVQTRFGGNSVYGKGKKGVYPPASYLMLWPFLGWVTWQQAQWLWAVVMVAALGWLAYLLMRESRADTLLERTFVGLLPLGMYATLIAIGNGQLIIFLLPALVAGLGLLHDRRRGGHAYLLAATLILVALISPTIAAPFFWLVIFVPPTLWPAGLVVLGYGGLTLAAVSLQGADVGLVHSWGTAAVKGASWGAVRGGYANLHSWLGACGLQMWDLPASLLVLAALGAWAYYHRQQDLWLLVGVTALVARLWAYHRVYDDLLIVLPMVTLFRLAKQSPSADRSGLVAGVLLAACWVAVIIVPTRVLRWPPPWNWLYQVGQILVWGAVLIFLLDQARRAKARSFGADSLAAQDLAGT